MNIERILLFILLFIMILVVAWISQAIGHVMTNPGV